MKTDTRKIKIIPGVIIDPSLNKYQDVVLFPKKLEEANRRLAENPIPEHLLNSKPKPRK